MERIVVVIFDHDGTVVDTGDSVRGSFSYCLQEHGYPLPPDEILAPILPGPLKVSLAHFCPDGNIDQLIQAYSRFEAENHHLIKLYPQTVDALERLRRANIPLGIVTSRGTKSTKRILTRLGIAEFFQIVVGNDLVENPKPDPEGINKVLDHFQALPDLAYMVGDTQNDILAGKAAKTRTIGLLCGMDGLKIVRSEPDHIGAHLGHAADTILAGKLFFSRLFPSLREMD